MGERYLRVFQCEENLYVEGAPIIICAGGLTKDNADDSVLVQLRMKNIGDATIKAVTVHIFPKDTAGRTLGADKTFQYLDLNVARDQEWGAQIPIYLDDKSIRAFDVAIDEIVFADNSVYKGSGECCRALPRTQKIKSKFGDDELVKQYCIATGVQARIVPQEERGLWFCTCENINNMSEKNCHVCRKSFQTMLDALDIEALTQARDERLNLERQKTEEKRIAKEKAEEERRIVKEREAARIKRIAVLLLGLCIVSGVTIGVITKYIIPRNKYNVAYSRMENGEIDLAVSGFSEIAGYRDAEELASWKAYYIRGNELLEGGYYTEALEMYAKISANNMPEDLYDKMKLCHYHRAQNMMQEGKYNEALEIFLVIKDYENTQELISECYYMIGSGRKGINNLSAIEAFEKAGDYLDADTQILECKYQYVKDRLDNMFIKKEQRVIDFLNELVENEYKDSANLYEELYEWKISASVDLFTTGDHDRPEYSIVIYAQKNEQATRNVRVKWKMPGKAEKTYEVTVDNDYLHHLDYVEYVRTELADIKLGTATIQIYDSDTNELIYTCEEEITYY